MDQERKSKVVAWWCSGSSGITKSGSAPNSIHFTAPLSQGGLQGRWAPEELLLASLATCFATTFCDTALRAHLPYTSLQVEAQGVVQTAGPQPKLGKILVHAHLTLPNNDHRDLALELLNQTLAECEVSRALAIRPSLREDVTVNETPVVA